MIIILYYCSHHVLCDFVLCVKLLQVLLGALLLRIGSEVSLDQIVHYVVLSYALNSNSTLDKVNGKRMKSA